MKRNMLFALMLVTTLMSYSGMTWAGEADVQPTGETVATGDEPVNGPEGLEMELRTIEDFDVAYVEAKGMEEIEQGFGMLFAAADKQQLIDPSLMVYLVYHGDLYSEPAEDAVFEPAITLPEGAAVAAPLKLQTIPGGDYYVVMHHGSYEALEETYIQFLIWADEQGIKFDDRPNFECYLTDPDTTPVEEWLTEIYFPAPMAEVSAETTAVEETTEVAPEGESAE